MLTTTKINDTLKIAYCKLATKTLSYIKKLSFGIKDKCSLKQLNLLRAYIRALSNHKIVGELSSCCCSIKNNYNVTLDNGLQYNFQFLKNGTGTMYDGINTFSFTWSQDCNTNNLYLNFPVNPGILTYINSFPGLTDITFAPNTEIKFGDYENIDGFDNLTDFITDYNLNNTDNYTLVYNEDLLTINSNTGNIPLPGLIIKINEISYESSVDRIIESQSLIILENIDFNSQCDFTYSGEFSWYYDAEITVTGIPAPFNGGLVNITIKNDLGVTVISKDYPVTYTQEEIINAWNNDVDCLEYFMFGENNNYQVSTYFGQNYTNYELSFSQYEGGNDAIWGTTINPLAFIGQGLVTVNINGNVVYNENDIDFESVEDFVNSFNNLNTLGAIMVYNGIDTLAIFAPLNTFAEYNGYNAFITSYISGFDEYSSTFEDGVTPELVIYDDLFELNNTEKLFETTNPCTPVIVEQTCLSNNDIENIVNHVNKL